MEGRTLNFAYLSAQLFSWSQKLFIISTNQHLFPNFQVFFHLISQYFSPLSFTTSLSSLSYSLVLLLLLLIPTSPLSSTKVQKLMTTGKGNIRFHFFNIVSRSSKLQSPCLRSHSSSKTIERQFLMLKVLLYISCSCERERRGKRRREMELRFDYTGMLRKRV